MKSIIIVGAEEGAGLYLAGEFFNRNYHVMGICREGRENSDLKAVGYTDPNRLEIKFVDVGNTGSVEALYDSLISRVFDIFFYDAGISGPFHRCSLQASGLWETDLFQLTLGPVRMAKRLGRFMKQSGGMIVFMTSYSGDKTGETNDAVKPYRESKTALKSLARNLYLHFSGAGRTILIADAGRINTEISKASVKGIANAVEQYYGSGELIYTDRQEKS